MVRKFINKSIPVEVVKIDDFHVIQKVTKDTPIWLVDSINNGSFCETPDGDYVFMYNDTTAKVNVGDYIICDSTGSKRICQKHIFEATYEEYFE